MSDTMANTVRSMLAEFLVAKAMGAWDQPRVEWDSCDLRIPEGGVEVKASAYLQAWDQRAPSQIVFGGLRARTWSPRDGYSSEPTYNADVYVFALLTAMDHAGYDALDTAGWLFWVAPVAPLAERGASSVSLLTLRAISGEPVGYPQLADAIRDSLEEHGSGAVDIVP